MKKIIPIFILMLAAAVFSGCSEDEDPGNADNKQAKITLSVSDGFNKADGDHFTFGVGGTTTAGTYVDWEVDGEVEKGVVISLGSDDVDGGKSGIVVESMQGFAAGNLNIGTFNIDGEPFTLTYKVEVNGKVLDEQTVEIEAGSDPYTKVYQL